MRLNLTFILGMLMLVFAASGCSTMGDVATAKDSGTSEIYPVDSDQAWDISMTVFRWEGADAIEEHRDQGYMLTSSGMNLVSYGAVMGAWIDPIDGDHTKVTVVSKRRVTVNLFTTMMESTFHKRFTQAVKIIKAGDPLPVKPPSD